MVSIREELRKWLENTVLEPRVNSGQAWWFWREAGGWLKSWAQMRWPRMSMWNRTQKGKGQNPKQHRPLRGGQRKSFHFESYQLGYEELENKNGIFHIFPLTIVSSKVLGTQCVINACYEWTWHSFTFLIFLPIIVSFEFQAEREKKEREIDPLWLDPLESCAQVDKCLLSWETQWSLSDAAADLQGLISCLSGDFPDRRFHFRFCHSWVDLKVNTLKSLN